MDLITSKNVHSRSFGYEIEYDEHEDNSGDFFPVLENHAISKSSYRQTGLLIEKNYLIKSNSGVGRMTHQ